MYRPQFLLTLPANPSIQDFPNLENIIKPLETNSYLATAPTSKQSQPASNFFTESLRC